MDDALRSGWPWALVALAGGIAIGLAIAPSPAPPRGGWTSYAEVYAAVAPVVVSVSVESPEARVGSGFAVGPERVVTAGHLVEGAAVVTVRTIDGQETTARVVGSDARTDLALLEAPGARFETATLGTADSLAVGDTVLAIGNPYGLGHSLSVGVLGSRDRRMAVVAADGARVDFLQLTIPLNPGNSGGPIFDDGGRVVGVLAGTHPQGHAIAFAVPVESVREVLPALARGDRLSRGFLGVRTEAAEGGVVVVSVMPGGPGDRAGVRTGDLIRAVDGQAIAAPEGLRRLMDAAPVTSTVTLDVVRGDKARAIAVALSDRAVHAVVVAGMTLRAEAGSGGEVVAVRPRSRAEAAGVQPGDIVRAVDGIPVLAPADVQDLLAGGRPARLEVLRDGLPATLRLDDPG